MMQNVPYLWKKGLKIAQLLKLVLKYMYIYMYDWNHIPRNEPPSQYRKSTMFHMWNLGFSDSLGERIPLNARNIGASTLDPSSVKLLLGQISYIIERHTPRSCNSYKFMIQLHNVIQLYLIHRVSLLWVKLGSNVLNALPTYYHQRWWSTLYIYWL